jgi:hypothetical protein
MDGVPSSFRKPAALIVALTLIVAMSCAELARAETSIYVAEQPGLSLVLKAEGKSVYATYLHAELLCYGAGGHWHEGAEAVSHRAFQASPVELRRRESEIRLVRSSRGEFDSWREVIAGKVLPDRIVGTFSYYASGEALAGKCESNRPGFEPQFGEREPPVPFEAKRYAPLGSPLAAAPDPAAAALYFAGSRALELYLWVEGRSVTRIHGAAELACASRKGRRSSKRAALGLEAPYLLGEDRSFDARTSLDYGFRTRSARLVGTVSETAVAGSFRILATHRSRDDLTRCRTGRRGGDGYVPYSATRYVLARAATSGDGGGAS